jgi:hypothetical protein
VNLTRCCRSFFAQFVTDNHLVTLIWRGEYGASLCTPGRGPLISVDRALRLNAQRLYAYGVWTDRNDLTRHSICFRFTLPGLPSPTQEMLIYENTDEAIEAAIDWGDRIIHAGAEAYQIDADWKGVWERGTVIDETHASNALHARSVVLSMARGSGPTLVTKEKLFQVKTSKDEIRSPVLPMSMNTRELVREFVGRCLARLEHEELIAPIYSGDLMDVRADHLGDFMSVHGKSVALPIVHTRPRVDTNGAVPAKQEIEDDMSGQPSASSECICVADRALTDEVAGPADPPLTAMTDIYFRCDEILAEFLEEKGLAVDGLSASSSSIGVPRVVQVVPPMKKRFEYGGRGFRPEQVPAKLRKDILKRFNASTGGAKKSLIVQQQLAALGTEISQDLIKKVVHLENAAMKEEGEEQSAGPVTLETRAWWQIACKEASDLKTSRKVCLAFNQRVGTSIDEVTVEPISFEPIQADDPVDVVYMVR